MKKLLAFVLVLGLASIANAALVFDMPAKAAPGDVIAIGVSSDVDVTVGIGQVKVNLSAAENVSVADVAVGPYSGPPFNFSPWDTNYGYPYLTVTPAAGGADVVLDALVGGFGPALAGDLFVITLTVPDVEMIDLAIVEGSVDGNYDITGPIGSIEVPEPMTMSLLALGGLGLIRRRRA